MGNSDHGTTHTYTASRVDSRLREGGIGGCHAGALLQRAVSAEPLTVERGTT